MSYTLATGALGVNRISMQQAMAKGHAILLGVQQRERTEAPSPAARFPGDAEGWSDAIAYARGKT